MGLLESFSFTGGESFMIGANGSEFTDRIGLNFGRRFNNKAFTKQKVMLEAEDDMNFSPMMYYNSESLLLKVANYIPPMTEELDNQILAIDTWRRETRLPPFFYDYFMDTFMMPAYTCDKMRP